MACCSLACSLRREFNSSVTRSLGSVAASASAELRGVSFSRSVRAIMKVSPHKFVTHSVNGQKITRFFGNRFELLAQPDNVSIHSARGRKIFIAPNLIKKAVPAQRLAGMTNEMFEKLNFLPGHSHARPAAKHLVTAKINSHVPKTKRVLL